MIEDDAKSQDVRGCATGPTGGCSVFVVGFWWAFGLRRAFGRVWSFDGLSSLDCSSSVSRLKIGVEAW